ncbi:hypothetical protein K440DRAFT_620851, partial [Wilcoxina mikolae CBS 423.85]
HRSRRTPFLTRRAGSSHSSTSKVTLLPQLPVMAAGLWQASGASLTFGGDAFHGSSQQPCAIANTYG